MAERPAPAARRGRLEAEAARSQAPLEIRPSRLDSEGLAPVARLVGETFPDAHHLDLAYLVWDYLENPAGRAMAFDACCEGELVGHLGARPMRARIDGALECGLVFQHAATRPEHRGRGLFSRFGEAILRAGADAGPGFALAAPNRLSLDLFVHGLGFQYVRPLDVRVGLGPTPRGDVRPASLQLDSAWDREAVAWRVRCPGIPYRARRRGDRCRLYAPAGLLGIWMEVADLPRELVPDTVPELVTRNPLRAWLGLDPTRAWAFSPYLEVPVRMRPAPLHLVFHDLRGSGRRLAGDRLRLCALDFDAF